MKKIAILFITFLLAISCGNNSAISGKINRLAEQAEQNCEEFTEDDWEKSVAKYEELLEEYEENYDELTEEEKEEINKAIGRYSGLVFKYYGRQAANELKEAGKNFGSMMEGFLEAFDEE